jgi:hypothetical protein
MEMGAVGLEPTEVLRPRDLLSVEIQSLPTLLNTYQPKIKHLAIK